MARGLSGLYSNSANASITSSRSGAARVGLHCCATAVLSVVVATMAALPAAQAQGFSAAFSSGEPQQKGITFKISPQALAGGIFSAQLNTPKPLIGWQERFAGCPDGDTGNWSFDNVPAYGRMTTALITDPPIPGCPQANTYNTLF